MSLLERVSKVLLSYLLVLQVLSGAFIAFNGCVMVIGMWEVFVSISTTKQLALF